MKDLAWYAKNIKLVPIADLETPDGKEFVSVFRDHWWVVSEECTLWYAPTRLGMSPQCNHNKACAESVRDRLFPGFEVRQIPVALVSIRTTEFDYNPKTKPKNDTHTHNDAEAGGDSLPPV